MGRVIGPHLSHSSKPQVLSSALTVRGLENLSEELEYVGQVKLGRGLYLFVYGEAVVHVE